METNTKENFLKELLALANTEDVLSVSREVSELNVKFNDFLIEEERLRQVDLLERQDKGETVNLDEKLPDPIKDQFKEVLGVFLSKKKAVLEEKKAIEEANLKAKRVVLNQLKDLIQNEENIGKAFGTKKELNDKWKAIGPVPRGKDQELNADYFRLNEEFNYNINIYKQLQEHDYKRNGDLKNEVIDKLGALLKEEHIKTVESSLKLLQDEWNEIGPVNQELWEDFKERYWNNVKALYEKISVHYNELKAVRAEIIVKKKALLEQVKELVSQDVDSHKAWDTETKKLLKLQSDWKDLGKGTKEEDDALWKELRSACDQFFDRKKDFYEKRNSEFGGIKEKKESLIKEVEAIRESQDWKDTTLKIINIQKQWKKLGSAGPKHENKLWKEFRVHCDYFFDAKDAHFKKEEAAYEDNLNNKLALIEEIKSYKPTSEEVKTTITDLQDFAAKFSAIGNVPRDKKDQVYKDYKAALDAQYAQLKIDQSEKESILFQAKIDALKGSPNSQRALDKERSDLRNQISKLNKEVTQLENNLGFFGNTKGSNPLTAQVEKDIEKTKAKIDSLKALLKRIPKSE